MLTTGPGNAVIDGDTEVLSDVSLSCKCTVPAAPKELELVLIVSFRDIVKGM